jgi:hypothetical protein
MIQGGFVLLKFDEAVKSERWWDRYPIDVQFPNREGDWMLDIVTNTMPEFNYGGFQTWIQGCTTLEEVMEGYGMEEEPRPKPRDVVSSIIEDDTLLLPKDHFESKYVKGELGDRPKLTARYLTEGNQETSPVANTRDPAPTLPTARKGGRGRGRSAGRTKPGPHCRPGDVTTRTVESKYDTVRDKPVTNTGPGRAAEGGPKANKTVVDTTAAPPQGDGEASIKGCPRPPKRRRKRGKRRKKAQPSEAVS